MSLPPVKALFLASGTRRWSGFLFSADWPVSFVSSELLSCEHHVFPLPVVNRLIFFVPLLSSICSPSSFHCPSISSRRFLSVRLCCTVRLDFAGNKWQRKLDGSHRFFFFSCGYKRGLDLFLEMIRRASRCAAALVSCSSPCARGKKKAGSSSAGVRASLRASLRSDLFTLDLGLRPFEFPIRCAIFFSR